MPTQHAHEQSSEACAESAEGGAGLKQARPDVYQSLDESLKAVSEFNGSRRRFWAWLALALAAGAVLIALFS